MLMSPCENVPVEKGNWNRTFAAVANDGIWIPYLHARVVVASQSLYSRVWQSWPNSISLWLASIELQVKLFTARAKETFWFFDVLPQYLGQWTWRELDQKILPWSSVRLAGMQYHTDNNGNEEFIFCARPKTLPLSTESLDTVGRRTRKMVLYVPSDAVSKQCTREMCLKLLSVWISPLNPAHEYIHVLISSMKVHQRTPLSKNSAWFLLHINPQMFVSWRMPPHFAK